MKSWKVVMRTLLNLCKEAGIKHEHMIIAEELLVEAEEEKTIHNIKMIVYEHFNLSELEGDEEIRKREIVQARQIAMAMCLEFKEPDWSLEKIGREIGNKDHATVLHAKKKVEGYCEIERDYNHNIQLIRGKIIMKLRKPSKKQQYDKTDIIYAGETENMLTPEELCNF